ASPDDLLPLLEAFPDRAERQSVAEGAFEFLQRKRPLANVGALAPLRRSQKFPLGRLKPLMIVRTPRQFQAEFLKSAGVFFGAFYFVALVWSLAHFGGDRAVLPAL